MGYLTAWKDRKVLVTGGTGFIGQHVLRQGLRAGLEIHNLSTKAEALPGVHHHPTDLEDREQVFAILGAVKPHGIIHLVAAGVRYGAGDLTSLMRVNTLGLANLLAAAEATGKQPVVVIAGSGFEYAPQERPISESDPVAPFSAYGVSKAAATLCAGLYAKKMPITILRLFSLYGPGEKEPRLVPYIIATAQRGEPIELTACEQVRDYTYVEDVAECFWRTLALSPENAVLRSMNLGTGYSTTLRQFVDCLQKLLRKKGFNPKIKFGARSYRPQEPMIYLPNVDYLYRNLKWLPPTGVVQGLERTLENLL